MKHLASRIWTVGVVLTLAVCSAADQRLYLLTGPAFASQADAPVYLFRVDGAGRSLALIRTILDTPPSRTPCSVSVSPQGRLAAVVIDERTQEAVHVIDMDRPEAPVSVTMNYSSRSGFNRICMDGFLARSPDGRLMQVVELTHDVAPRGSILRSATNNGDVSGIGLIGVPLRPLAPEPKIEQLPWQYAARVEVSTVGWQDGPGQGLPDITVSAKGALEVVALGPASLSQNLDKKILDQVSQNRLSAFRLEVNTSDWLLLLRTHFTRTVPNGVGASYHDVLNKSSGDWQTFEVPGSETVLKNFGDWMAGTVVEGGSSRESPGRSHRPPLGERRGDRRFQVDYVWQTFKEYSPGELYLLNARTGRTSTIQTDEGDSEVLLIENGLVYYRVNDSMFGAPIGSENVGIPVLLATDPHIPDVHWAFLGPSGQVGPPKR